MNDRKIPYDERRKEQISEDEKTARRKISDEFTAFLDDKKIQGNVTTPHFEGTRGTIKIELYIPINRLKEIFRFGGE